MKLKKSTRYALYAAMELARADEGEQVPVARVAERYALPVSVLAKIFQQLARSGLAVGSRGVRGGYTLARAPSAVTVLDIIEAFESPLESELEELSDCRLRKLFEEVDELTRCTYASVTLETLVGSRSFQRAALGG
jgi:Rrf2 family protein